ncbi:hypothetical protein EW145_g7898 [Phellinidium pouzarii]|uniref:CCHC-type domain-containing protein n=1 Tax=Phellinidium pouzarii TaxID=167371 RepID=A0A4S4KCS6_9AGAM|nr:hypothetical protein EW145_g7898 [Phellinidium pouzarii]
MANINHLRDILNDPDLCPAIDNLIDQPENQAIQIPLYIHDTLLFNIHALRQQRRILANIIDTHSASLRAFRSMMAQNHRSEHIHNDQSRFFLNVALRHGAADVLSRFFEDVPTDISSDSSPPPIAIPNPETYPSGSPENPISIVDDSEDQFIEVSETAIQTSPTSSQSANHEHGSADRDTQLTRHSALTRYLVTVTAFGLTPTPPVSNIQQQQPQSTPLPIAPSTSTTSSHIPLSPQPTPTPLINMSTPAPTGEAHLSKPNNFDGDKSYAHCFLSSCQAYLSLNEQIYNMDKSKIIFVLSFMQEKAAGDWATNHTTVALAPNPTTNTPTGFGTWVDFLNDFRNTFITTDDSADARCQLLNIKQTGTADDYNTQFRSLVTRSNISDKNALSEMYQQGLTCGLIQRIYARDKLPDTMEEWYQAASWADNLYRRLQALNTTGTTTTSSAPCSTCFRNLFSTTTPSSPTPTNRPKKLTPKEHEKCMKEGCCLACHEVGHNARDCTKYKACTPSAATTICQVTPDPAPATPTPAAAEPAKPTSKAEIIAHIRSLLQNAGDNIAEEVLMELDNTDF